MRHRQGVRRDALRKIQGLERPSAPDSGLADLPGRTNSELMAAGPNPGKSDRQEPATQTNQPRRSPKQIAAKSRGEMQEEERQGNAVCTDTDHLAKGSTRLSSTI